MNTLASLLTHKLKLIAIHTVDVCVVISLRWICVSIHELKLIAIRSVDVCVDIILGWIHYVYPFIN